LKNKTTVSKYKKKLYFVAVKFFAVSQKTRHQTLGHNFNNYYPIFKIFSIADSVVNLQQIYVYSTTL